MQIATIHTPDEGFYFEPVSKYANAGLPLPVRKTEMSAGYDFVVAKDTVIPSYVQEYNRVQKEYYENHNNPVTLQRMSEITKESNFRPTLVSTGIKCHLPKGYYLELSVRSSTPLKNWIILANGVGIIDADYYNNPDNEGEIFFQLINLSPFPIALHKGDIIGQGIIKPYLTTDYDVTTAVRTGGFGSTSYADTVTAGYSSHAEGHATICRSPCRAEGINVTTPGPDRVKEYQEYLNG